MAFFRSVLIGIFCALVSVPAFAGVGSVDSREYVNWADYPQIVHLQMHYDSYSFGECTGQYVAPNLILTASHCIKDKRGLVEQGTNSAINYKREKFPIKLIYSPQEYRSPETSVDPEIGYDWAVFLVEDSRYYLPDRYFNTQILNNDNRVEVYNGGFGWVTKIYDHEIPKLKQEFKNYVDGLTPDANGVKHYDSNVLGHKFSNVLGRPLQDDFDDHKLKVDSTCSVSKNVSNKFLTSNCDAWPGNSGGAFIDRQTGYLLGLLTQGEIEAQSFRFEEGGNFAMGAAVDHFDRELKKLVRQYSVGSSDNTPATSNDSESPAVVADVVPEPAPKPEDVKEKIDTIEENIDKKEEELRKAAENKDITDKDIIDTVIKPVVEINKLKELEEAYKKAYEKEHSLANRMISGVAMATTGIGGMQLAQGLAEQSADKAAEADMQAYLATFTCKIGDAGGKSYKGGEMGIEVSGGNQLTSLYQQYVDLAADLKERKNALGMAPGIESTVVMDKANMGLYDEISGSGIENGTYASLYRASRGNESDQQKLAEQKDTSSNRVKGGAIAAGAGTVVGVGGNVLNNYVGKSGDGLDLGNIDIGKVAGAAAGVMSGVQ